MPAVYHGRAAAAAATRSSRSWKKRQGCRDSDRRQFALDAMNARGTDDHPGTQQRHRLLSSRCLRLSSRAVPAGNRAPRQARRPAWTFCPTPGTSPQPACRTDRTAHSSPRRRTAAETLPPWVGSSEPTDPPPLRASHNPRPRSSELPGRVQRLWPTRPLEAMWTLAGGPLTLPPGS